MPLFPHQFHLLHLHYWYNSYVWMISVPLLSYFLHVGTDLTSTLKLHHCFRHFWVLRYNRQQHIFVLAPLFNQASVPAVVVFIWSSFRGSINSIFFWLFIYVFCFTFGGWENFSFWSLRLWYLFHPPPPPTSIS